MSRAEDRVRRHRTNRVMQRKGLVQVTGMEERDGEMVPVTKVVKKKWLQNAMKKGTAEMIKEKSNG